MGFDTHRASYRNWDCEIMTKKEIKSMILVTISAVSIFASIVFTIHCHYLLINSINIYDSFEYSRMMYYGFFAVFISFFWFGITVLED